MRPSVLFFCLTLGSFLAAAQAFPAETARGRPPANETGGCTEDLLASATGRIGEVVFAVRSIIPEHWYANFGYFSPDENRKCYGKEGRLCKLNLATGQLKLPLDDPEGAVRDPCMHYDGRRIVFSYRRGGEDTYYLYEIQAGGSDVLGSTADPDYRTLLAMCAAGRLRLDEIKRFDMRGFRPRPEYVREMKRYGVLPPEFDASLGPLDVYAAERAYWKLVAWKPAGSGF